MTDHNLQLSDHALRILSKDWLEYYSSDALTIKELIEAGLVRICNRSHCNMDMSAKHVVLTKAGLAYQRLIRDD